MTTIRLTMAQALVRFLAAQKTQIDGAKHADLRRRVGDLRPWQCRRHGRGALRRARHAADLPRPQRAGHGARRDRLRQGLAPAPHDGLHHLDRPRRHQHGDRRRASRMSTACRCCCCPATSSPTAGPTRCCSRSRSFATARSRPMTASGRSRAISTASRGPSRSSRRSPRAMTVLTDPGRLRAGDAGASARTCRPRPTTIRQASSRSGLDAAPHRARTRPSSRRPSALLQGGEEAADRRRRRHPLFAKPRQRSPTSPRRTAFPSARPRPARRRSPVDHPLAMGASASPAPAPPTRSPRRPT